MERLTQWEVGGLVSIKAGWTNYAVAERLAAYEDTGLEPEEIKVHEAAKYNAGYYHGDEDRCRWIEKELGPIDHLSDLLQAEKEGRTVVLPCKVGDTVYQIDAERVYESEVKWIIFDCNDIAFDERAIGVSIFLTRDDAEAALALKGGTHEADSV